MQQAKVMGCFHGALTGIIWSVPDIACELFGEDWHYGDAFAYLWRRFGSPHFGSDADKELVTYALVDGNPDIILDVSPKPAGPSCSFRYLLSPLLYQKAEAEYMVHRREPNYDERQGRVIGSIVDVLASMMAELLTPVFIRDVGVNILGRVADKDLGATHYVECSKYAGYGITQDYFLKFDEFGNRPSVE